MDAVLDWFLSLPDRPALRAFGLHPMHTNNSVTITKLLTALENSLECFLISTVIADGMFVIFLNLIYAACQLRIALAIRPTPQHMLALPSNPAQWPLRRYWAGYTDAISDILDTHEGGGARNLRW
jgi:hypothetical protein